MYLISVLTDMKGQTQYHHYPISYANNRTSLGNLCVL